MALLRVGGIFAGGLLSVVLAVVVLPRSASVESLREMKKALKAMYDLNTEVGTAQHLRPKQRGVGSIKRPSSIPPYYKAYARNARKPDKASGSHRNATGGEYGHGHWR